MEQKKEKKEKIYMSKETTQLLFRRLASYSILNDSRAWVSLYESIQLLRSIVPEEIIKKEYDDNEEIDKILIRFGKKVYHINSYFSLIKDADFRDSNLWKKHYRNFLIALGDIPIIHTKVISFFGFLIKRVSFAIDSIPSEYLVQAKNDLMKFESKEGMERRIFQKKKEFYDAKLEESEKTKNDN